MLSEFPPPNFYAIEITHTGNVLVLNRAPRVTCDAHFYSAATVVCCDDITLPPALDALLLQSAAAAAAADAAAASTAVTAALHRRSAAPPLRCKLCERILRRPASAFTKARPS